MKHDDRKPRTAKRRMLLVATVGLASLSIVGCGGTTSGNLIAPPPTDAGTDAPTPNDAATDAHSEK